MARAEASRHATLFLVNQATSQRVQVYASIKGGSGVVVLVSNFLNAPPSPNLEAAAAVERAFFALQMQQVRPHIASSGPAYYMQAPTRMEHLFERSDYCGGTQVDRSSCRTSHARLARLWGRLEESRARRGLTQVQCAALQDGAAAERGPGHKHGHKHATTACWASSCGT